jgi:hypothetical protein|tara:strand:+ start:399 stop:677 length:279 start_codon:yes stop_codon:yes gene_type:complete
MKSYRQLMNELRAMSIDLDKARKNKIFKRESDKAEKIIFALIRDGFKNLNWNVSSDGWELRLTTPKNRMEIFQGNSALQTLENAMKEFRIRL